MVIKISPGGQACRWRAINFEIHLWSSGKNADCIFGDRSASSMSKWRPAWTLTPEMIHFRTKSVGLSGMLIDLLTISTFTYYGSLEIEKLIKIVFWAQIGSSQALEAGWCDFDSFCFAYSHGKLFARSWRHLGAIIFAPFGRACVKVAWERSFVCHPRAWQKACQHFDKLCDNA